VSIRYRAMPNDYQYSLAANINAAAPMANTEFGAPNAAPAVTRGLVPVVVGTPVS
jgi:hypothetical protein